MNYEDFRPYLTNNPKRAYTIVGLTFLALAGFGFFAIRPTVTTALRLVKERRDGLAADYALDQKIAALSQAQVNLANQENNLALLDTKLPLQEDIASILEQVALKAGENGVKLMGVKQYSPTAISNSPNPLKVTKVALTLEGEFANLEAAINSLERLPRLCLIRSSNFQVKGTWGGSTPEAIKNTVLQTQLELEFYAYEEKPIG
ncbi:MAG: type 4a pilus biogenesis protein PilO [bacterium]|nr:type 4a pilus biogenesis protein PilO [bacterium]